MNAIRRIMSSAQEIVRTRLRARGTADGSDADWSKVALQDPNLEKDIVKELARLIGVDAAYLRANDRIGELLCVQRAELPADVQALLECVGLRDTVLPFAIDLLAFVERRVGSDERLSKTDIFQPVPRSEDELIACIDGLTVHELAEALA